MQEFKYLNASGNFTDTETTVRVTENAAYVTVKCLPGLQWWSCPNAKILRGFVDNAISGTGKKRDGARYEKQYNPGQLTWDFVYYLKNGE